METPERLDTPILGPTAPDFSCRGTHREIIVLHNELDRQLMPPSVLGAIVHRTGSRRHIPDEDVHRVTSLAPLDRQRHAQRYRQRPTNNGG